MPELTLMFVLGLIAGFLVSHAWKSDREIRQYADDSEHGRSPL